MTQIIRRLFNNYVGRASTGCRRHILVKLWFEGHKSSFCWTITQEVVKITRVDHLE